MDGDKAPGLDGFTVAFFQSCWVIVKDDLMCVFHNFHVHSLFKKRLNATFIGHRPYPPKDWAVGSKGFQTNQSSGVCL